MASFKRYHEVDFWHLKTPRDYLAHTNAPAEIHNFNLKIQGNRCNMILNDFLGSTKCATQPEL